MIDRDVVVGEKIQLFFDNDKYMDSCCWFKNDL